MIPCHREIQERDQIFNVVLLITQPPASDLQLVWDHLQFLMAEIQFREHLSSSCGSESAGLWANRGGQRVWKTQRETSRKVCVSQAACGCPSAWSLMCGNVSGLCYLGEWVKAHLHTALLKPQMMTASYGLCKTLLQILLWQKTVYRLGKVGLVANTRNWPLLGLESWQARKCLLGLALGEKDGAEVDLHRVHGAEGRREAREGASFGRVCAEPQ